MGVLIVGVNGYRIYWECVFDVILIYFCFCGFLIGVGFVWVVGMVVFCNYCFLVVCFILILLFGVCVFFFEGKL